MKTCYRFLFATLLLTTTLNTKATTWTVTVQSFDFVGSPASVTVGDTIVWVWVNGSHTTTSNTIPAGAMPWNEDITALFPTYAYVVEVPGTYGYHCIPHQGMMNETFVALPAGGPLEVNVVVANTVACVPGGCIATADITVTGGTPP
ncbi:MAG TPA: plastocyanin/azurin family copper-binding protein, partial [Chitinophagales bacterium]|nr:plastocyanin/azurin family copper-binding protein [Chitinophagales bacterium]